MLILVGVTINVALNGGLFEKAKNASTQTQREIEREQLISTILGGYNSRGSFNIDNVGDLPDNAKWCKETDSNWEDTTPVSPTSTGSWIITKSNNKFYVDSNGNILDEMPDIWTVRGLDTSKVIIGKQYEFNAITYYGNEYNFEITLYSDGSVSWNNGFNTEDGDVPSQDVTDILNSYVSCNGNVFSILDGDMQNDVYENPYITIVFNNNTATAYIAETLGGTSETYYVTTK